MVKIRRWLVLQLEIIKSRLRTLIRPKNKNGFQTIIHNGKDINTYGAYEALEDGLFNVIKKHPEILDKK